MKTKASGEDTDLKLQEALEKLHKIGEFVKLDTTAMTFHPEENDCERLFSAYLKKRGNKSFTPTYSTMKSVHVIGGRLIYAAICQSTGLNPSFNPSGCYIWHHGWTENKTRCFHGEKMIQKVNEIEMTPTSEMGIQALKDGRGILVTNKYHKQMVKITQPNYVICSEDSGQKFGQLSQKSCGLFFTDGKKAILALANAVAVTEAVFPKAPSMKNILFMLGQCECNYTGKKIMGRQLPKIVPFSIPGTEGIDYAHLEAVPAAAVKFPATFVFQCCNAQGGTRRQNGSKFCEMKISHMDMIQCLSRVRKMWTEVFGETMPLQFQKFKWENTLQVKNAVLPDIEESSEELPFGEIDEPPKKKKKTARLAESSSEDSDEEEEN